MEYLTSKAAKILLSVVMSLLILSPVLAQAGSSRVYVNRLTAVEGEGQGGFKGVSLTWDFVLLDEKDYVISDTEIEAAEVSLQNGDSREAKVNLSASPWSIVILVDASTTMASANTAFKDALQALSGSIGQLPDSSSIAVLKFDEEPATVVKFTKEKELVEKALRESISASATTKKSCLNNAAYEAISLLSGASSRRALVLVTASADNCEERQVADVVKYAQDNAIQIFAVGLEGQPVNQDQLQQLAAQTGGQAMIKRPDVIDFAFGSIFGPLISQWQARATLYPTTAGKQAARLTVFLKDGSTLTSEDQEFISPRVYSPPPEIRLRGDVLPTFEGLTFNLDISSRSLVQKLDIFVDNKKTTSREYSQIDVQVPEGDQLMKMNLIIPKWVTGEEYTLLIQALDKNGGALAPVSRDFKYEPTGQIQITIDAYQPDAPEIVVRLDSANLGTIGKYEAWLVAQCSELDELPGTKAEVAAGDPYMIQTGGLETGKYYVVAQAIDQNNQVVLTRCEEQVISFVKPGWWPTVISGLRQSPLAIMVVTLLGILALGILAWQLVAWKQRASRPKPVPVHFPKVVRSAPAPSLEAERVREYRLVEQRAAPAILPLARLSGTLPSGTLISAQIIKPSFIIGRAPECDLMIRVEKSAGVSRQHAAITFSGGAFYIEDSGSSFGTLLNDQDVPKGSRARLEDGMIIQLGPSVKIKFNVKNSS